MSNFFFFSLWKLDSTHLHRNEKYFFQKRKQTL